VTILPGVAATVWIEDPPEQDGDHEEGDESTDQRPVHRRGKI
jgi:hypothetical protein